jgi:hypothetical protein
MEQASLLVILFSLIFRARARFPLAAPKHPSSSDILL